MTATDQVPDEMPDTDDIIVNLLKGHLLLEQRLLGVLKAACREPEHLKDSRIRFLDLVAIVRALVGDKGWPGWQFLQRLNSARNKVAHKLDPGDLSDIVASVRDELQFSDEVASEEPVASFRVAMQYVCGYLDSKRFSTKMGPAYSGGAV